MPPPCLTSMRHFPHPAGAPPPAPLHAPLPTPPPAPLQCRYQPFSLPLALPPPPCATSPIRAASSVMIAFPAPPLLLPAALLLPAYRRAHSLPPPASHTPPPPAPSPSGRRECDAAHPSYGCVSSSSGGLERSRDCTRARAARGPQPRSFTRERTPEYERPFPMAATAPAVLARGLGRLPRPGPRSGT